MKKECHYRSFKYVLNRVLYEKCHAKKFENVGEIAEYLKKYKS